MCPVVPQSRTFGKHPPNAHQFVVGTLPVVFQTRRSLVKRPPNAHQLFVVGTHPAVPQTTRSIVSNVLQTDTNLSSALVQHCPKSEGFCLERHLNRHQLVVLVQLCPSEDLRETSSKRIPICRWHPSRCARNRKVFGESSSKRTPICRRHSSSCYPNQNGLSSWTSSKRTPSCLVLVQFLPKPKRSFALNVL